MPDNRIRNCVLVGLMVTTPATLACQVETATSETPSQQDPADNYSLLKQMLTGDQADTWWWDMRGKWSPAMKLWVVSMSPPERPTIFRLGPERRGAPEVTLHLEPGWEEEIIPWDIPAVGEEALFDGTPSNLSLRPFHLTLEKARVWPLRRPQTGFRPLATLTVEPSSIVRGEGAALEWASENALTATVNHQIGRVESKGSREVFPATTTTYTITVRGYGGEASATATVAVSEPRQQMKRLRTDGPTVPLIP